MKYFLAAALSAPLLMGLFPLPAEAGLSLSVMALAKKCAPDASPLTMGYLVAHESRNDQFAFNINGGHELPWTPTNRDEAVALIKWLEEKGYNYDIGYGQVNSSNFSGLKVTAESLLDGCNNLRASFTILSGCYAQAVKEVGEGQRALGQAFSCYNTGSQTKGFENGYVQKILAQAQTTKIPALQEEGEPVLSSQEKDKDIDDKGSARPPKKLGRPDAFNTASTGAFSSGGSGSFAEGEAPEQSDR